MAGTLPIVVDMTFTAKKTRSKATEHSHGTIPPDTRTFTMLSSFANFDFDETAAPVSSVVDYSRIFDETDLDDLFRSESFNGSTDAERNSGGACGGNGGGGASVVSNPEAEQATQSSTADVAQPSSFAEVPGSLATVPPQSFVNIVMIVDPVTQQVICPQQVLEYVVNGKTERLTFGPTVLDALPQDMQHLASIASQQTQTACASTMATQPSTLDVSSDEHSATSSLSILPNRQPDLPDGAIAAPVANHPSQSAGTPPLRALSAYNFFFRDERDRILHGGDHEWTGDKQQKLLAAHWNQDRSKKRRHRKSHGKIDFTTLSRLISSRWKELSEDHKEFYRQVAAQDWERFQRELDEFKKPAGGGGAGSGNDGTNALAPSDASMVDQFQTVIG